MNTPFGTEAKNPAECMPRQVRDTKHGFYAFRNRWADENDIVITQLTRRSPARFRHGPDKAMVIQHHGGRETWGSIPATVTHWRPGKDGSTILGDGETFVAIDFSGASGAERMIVMAGPNAADGTMVEADGRTFAFKFLQPDGATEPEPRAEGNHIVVGEQKVGMQEGVLVLGEFAE